MFTTTTPDAQKGTTLSLTIEGLALAANASVNDAGS